jgi:uncharacterized protein (TIGR00255 family)
MESMTGYAHADIKLASNQYRIHAKSVNSKGFEFRWRVPKNWLHAEIEVRRLFQERFRRGTLDVWVETQTQSSSANSSAILNLSSEFQKQLESLRPGLSENVATSLLLRFPELWRSDELVSDETNSTPSTDMLLKSIQPLVETLKISRLTEGGRLKPHFIALTETLETAYNRVKSDLPTIEKQSSELFQKRVQDCAEKFQLATVNASRVAEEFVLLMERRDIAEEIKRIEVHLVEWHSALDHPTGPWGKKLEFLANELHREWTTLSNKIQATEVQMMGMDAKLAIDRLKEQSANIV